MPVCEGLPNGACPKKVNDRSVAIGKGDLLLCPSCDTERRRLFDEAQKAKEKKGRNNSTAAPKSPVTRSSTEKKLHDTDTVPAEPIAASAVEQQRTTSGSSVVPSPPPCTTITIIDELLAYTKFYRNRCTSAELHRLICHFYLPAEISASKATVTSQFKNHLVGCPFITSRRHTTSRPAHDAEIEDILGILEFLDNANVLCTVQFAAVAIDRLPKYGPNEINICTVVDRQQQIDKELNELKEAICSTTANSSSAQLLTAASDKILEAINSTNDKFNGQMRQLEAMCQNLNTVTSAAINLNKGNARSSTTPTVPTSEERAANIIVFGLGEDRNSSAWNSVLLKALQHVAGRPVEIADAFRIGKYNPAQVRNRPVIVKLRNVWDKRLLLSNARKLSETAEFRRIGFAPDEPLETRRKNTMKRLHFKATNEGKHVALSADGDCLYVDNVIIFSMKDGLIRNKSNDNVSKPQQ